MKLIDPIAELKLRQGTMSLREFASRVPCSAPYLSDVYNKRREPGPLILRFLGLEKVKKTEVLYVRTSHGRMV